MDVRQLKYFLAVADHEGFSRAAEHLLIAQPSLSQTIKSLEQEIGLPLFHRVGRRVVLSEAGKELLGPARLVVRDLDAARSAMAELKGIHRGRLELSAMPSPAIEPLTTLIARYTQLHPQISVSTAAAFTVDEVVSSVRSGSSEIGLLGADRPIAAPGVDVVQLERQPLMLIISPLADSFGPGETLDSRDLGGERIIVSQRGSLMRSVVDGLVARGVDLRIVAEVAHRTSILPMVLAGVGHAILPISWAPIARRSGLRVARLEPVTQLHVAIISRQDNLTPAAQSFLSLAQDYSETRSGQHL